MKIALFAAALLLLTGVLCGAAPPAFSPGVVFFCPDKPDAALAELAKIQGDGFSLIEFASWCWTLPTPGSDIEKRAQAVLGWCDAHNMSFFLMHNIQIGSAGEGGALDDAVEDPLRATKYLTDWVRVLKGHKCVTGIILGNEVGPVAGNPKDNPKWWAAFVADLKTRYQTIADLNAVWGTAFASFDAVAVPDAKSPGQVDARRFATQTFDHFYGTLFSQVCEPELGKLLYGCKMGGDPLVQRACGSLSMICWDDVLADYPQWRTKALGDVSRATTKPVFNAELHLYNDNYAYGGSAAHSRYRYFMSALNGEWLTASFAWGLWNKPETHAIHKATPAILADLKKLEPQLRRFSAVQPVAHVLLSEPLAADDAAAQSVYADLAELGSAWEFVCPQDIGTITGGTVYVPQGTRLPLDAWYNLPRLVAGVNIVLASGDPLDDEYGRPLPEKLQKEIAARAQPAYGVRQIRTPADDTLGLPYDDRVDASYLNWSEKRGHFRYPLAYPRLEARRVAGAQGWLVAVINHATEGAPVTARLPWSPGATAKVTELTGAGGPVDPTKQLSFAPLDVRLFTYSGGTSDNTAAKNKSKNRKGKRNRRSRNVGPRGGY